MINKEYIPIPRLLSHHTNINAVKSILISGEGTNKEICFRAYDNLSKNDANEIKLGKELLNIIVNRIKGNKWGSFLTQATNYENTGSISFTEGSSTLHMKEEYGTFRLDFDLRNIEKDRLFFSKCEYVYIKDINQYANELFNELKNIRTNLRDDFANLFPKFAILELDILRKPLFIKEPKWKEEKEWRHIVEFKESDTDIIWDNQKRYKNIYYPASCLKNISILYTEYNEIEIDTSTKEVEEFLANYPEYKHVTINTEQVS